MDVPYSASGALTREQYALVRKVELAASPGTADQFILEEIQAIRGRLAQSGLSSKHCKEHLVLLLYCTMAITSEKSGALDVSFAFSHAVNLAEAGRTLQDKRIGYLFCNELLPKNHDMQLMLVNTLRKDIESDTVPRLCLALDTLIHAPSSDVIPAVQHRLYDLLSHTSPQVRRRALLALTALSRLDGDLLKRVVDKCRRRAKDIDAGVANAALHTCHHLVSCGLLPVEQFGRLLEELLQSTWRSHRLGQINPSELLPILRALGRSNGQIGNDTVRTILSIIQWSASGSRHHSILLEAFRVLKILPLAQLLAAKDIANRKSPTGAIRNLLSSHEPNEVYLFVTCLECVDPQLWAGTDPTVLPAVLDSWEVERVMKLLDSRDSLMRKKTLRILYTVDPGIIKSYQTRMLQSVPNFTLEEVRNEYAARLLEIAAVTSGGDGREYVSDVRSALAAIEGAKTGVLEKAVELVLLHIRDGTGDFKQAAVHGLLGAAAAPDATFGPSVMVIFAALSCEYEDLQVVPPVDVLRGLALRLASYAASIQDACLLAMLRISADCESVPGDVIDIVKALLEKPGRYIRRRCDQFLHFSQKSDILKGIVSSSKSSTLPDFMMSLEALEHASPRTAARALGLASPRAARAPISTSPTTQPLSLTPRSPGPSVQKLRYAAYDAPPPVPQRLNGAGSASPRQSSSVTRVGPRSPRSSRGVRLSEEGMAALERTLTPGELALTSGGNVMELHTFAQEKSPVVTDTRLLTSPLQMPREDLITLDSPFLADPRDSASDVASSVAVEANFKRTWDAMQSFTSRGWCDVPIDAAVRRIQSLRFKMIVLAADQAPFEGSLKVLVKQSDTSADDASVDSARGAGTAALRLREGEDESCLWQMRCDDEALGMQIKARLSDE